MRFTRNIFFFSTTIIALLLCPTQLFGAQQNDGVFKTIVIDPGHGGPREVGTVFGKILEKDINLKISLLVGDMIKESMPDIKVIYTRDKDVAVGLKQRAEIANNATADLFISIHVNSVNKGVTPPSGALTLVMGNDKVEDNLDVATRENQVIMYEEDYTTTYKDYISGSLEMDIVYSLVQYVNIDRSIKFANLLQKYYKTDTPMPDKGIRHQNPLVLWYTTMPAVLTELGFMPNDADRKVLTSEKGQKQMAAAIFSAIKEYRQFIEESNKPLAVEAQQGRALTTAHQENQQTTSALPPVEPVVRSTTSQATNNNDVIFRVQILSSTKKIAANSRELKGYAGKAIETEDNKRFRYYVEECKTYSEVIEKQAQVRKSFPDAFAVAFRGDKRIDISEARKLTE